MLGDDEKRVSEGVCVLESISIPIKINQPAQALRTPSVHRFGTGAGWHDLA